MITISLLQSASAKFTLTSWRDASFPRHHKRSFVFVMHLPEVRIATLSHHIQIFICKECWHELICKNNKQAISKQFSGTHHRAVVLGTHNLDLLKCFVIHLWSLCCSLIVWPRKDFWSVYTCQKPLGGRLSNWNLLLWHFLHERLSSRTQQMRSDASLLWLWSKPRNITAIMWLTNPVLPSRQKKVI